MDESGIPSRSDAAARSEKAIAELARLLEDEGWKVVLRPPGPARPDMIIRRGPASYVVEVKAAAEGRADRLVPLWSQAHLQALRMADERFRPLAIVAAPRIAPRAADQIISSIAELAPEAAAGVVDFIGLRRFRGPYLEHLDSAGPHSRSGHWANESHAERPALWPAGPSVHHSPTDIFSDLNQWMLKVLLAPEIPLELLTAPRERYHDASHLARNAKVSVMSASRLVRQLEHEGYLDRAKPWLDLVRRPELFHRWQAVAGRRIKEARMRFLLRGKPDAELRKMLKNEVGALALFSAAEALHLGFVHGVPQYVYVPRLDVESIRAWKNLVPVDAGEEPDVIVRQAPAVHSVFRGVVHAGAVSVSDVLQVWLDVSSHPSRGQEQADFIRKRVLGRVIDAG
jgi:hypothetical protein